MRVIQDKAKNSQVLDEAQTADITWLNEWHASLHGIHAKYTTNHRGTSLLLYKKPRPGN